MDKIKIKVDVAWSGSNYCASLSDNVPGAVVLTAPTYKELKKKVPETLRFHIEGMVANGDSVPQWLLNGNYKFEYVNYNKKQVIRRVKYDRPDEAGPR